MRIRTLLVSTALVLPVFVIAPSVQVAATPSLLTPTTVQIQYTGGLHKGLSDAQFGPDGTLYVARTDTESTPSVVGLDAYARDSSAVGVAYVSSPFTVTLPSDVAMTRGLAINADGTKLALTYGTRVARPVDENVSGILVYDLPLTGTSVPSRVITGVNTASDVEWDRLGNLWVNAWSPDGWWYAVMVYGPSASEAATALKQLDLSLDRAPMALLLGADNRLTMPMAGGFGPELWSYAYDSSSTPSTQPAPDATVAPLSMASEYWTSDALGRLYFARVTDGQDPALATSTWDIRTFGSGVPVSTPTATVAVARGATLNLANWNSYYGTGPHGPYVRIDPSDGSLVILTQVRSGEYPRRFFYWMDRYPTSTDPAATNAVVVATATMPAMPTAIDGSAPSPAPEPPSSPSPPSSGEPASAPPGEATSTTSATSATSTMQSSQSEATVVDTPAASTKIATGPVVPGIAVLAPVNRRPLVAAPSLTAADAPRVRISRGSPAVLRLTGLTPGTVLSAGIAFGGRDGVLGSVTVGADGRVTLPPLRLTQRGTAMVVLTDPVTGAQRFVRLVVPAGRGGR